MSKNRTWFNYISITYLLLLFVVCSAWAQIGLNHIVILAYTFPYALLIESNNISDVINGFFMISFFYAPLVFLYYVATDEPEKHSIYGKVAGVLFTFAWFIIVTVAMFLAGAH